MNAAIPTPPPTGTGELHLEELAFDGTSTASCAGDITFTEFGTVDGHLVNAWLNPSGGVYLSISVTPADAKSTDGYWYYESNPTTDFSTEIADDDLSGTVEFAGLPLYPGDPGASTPVPPPELSGTISWDCQ